MICNLKSSKLLYALVALLLIVLAMPPRDIKVCYLIVIYLCGHFKTRSISFLDFKKYNIKVNKKPVNKYSEFVPINVVSKGLEL